MVLGQVYQGVSQRFAEKRAKRAQEQAQAQAQQQAEAQQLHGERAVAAANRKKPDVAAILANARNMRPPSTMLTGPTGLAAGVGGANAGSSNYLGIPG